MHGILVQMDNVEIENGTHRTCTLVPKIQISHPHPLGKFRLEAWSFSVILIRSLLQIYFGAKDTRFPFLNCNACLIYKGAWMSRTLWLQTAPARTANIGASV